MCNGAQIATQIRLAQALAKAGKAEQADSLFDQAQGVAAQINDAKARSDAQSALAKALAKVRRFRQARTAAEQLGATEAVAVYSAMITTYYSKPER